MFGDDPPVDQSFYIDFDAVWAHDHILSRPGDGVWPYQGCTGPSRNLPAVRQRFSGDRIAVVLGGDRFRRQGAIREQRAIRGEVLAVSPPNLSMTVPAGSWAGCGS